MITGAEVTTFASRCTASSLEMPLDVAFIDNYDSFSFNVVQYLQELGANVTVFRNDALTVEELAALSPRRIVISPGPGAPRDAGISCDVIRHFAGKVPILGVCLGAYFATADSGVVPPAAADNQVFTSACPHPALQVFNACSRCLAGL